MSQVIDLRIMKIHIQCILPYFSATSYDEYGCELRNVFSAPPDLMRVRMALASFGFESNIERPSYMTMDGMLQDIITSIDEGKPVILCEIDPTWYLRNRELSELFNDDSAIQSYEGLSLYYQLHLDENGNGFAQPISYSTTSMADHYVTITGVICDRISNETWLRVQTWGRIRYLNYSDFYNHISPSYPNTAMGSIIIPE